MLRMKLYLGSERMERCLNMKAKKGYVLESITPFTLFEPLRIDVYQFIKAPHKNRTYRVLPLSQEKYSECKEYLIERDWKVFHKHYANDEYIDYIFYTDQPFNKELPVEFIYKRNQNNAQYTFFKGLYLALIFLGLAIIFPIPNYSNTLIGFLLHYSYIIIALLMLGYSFVLYKRNK